VGAGHNYCWPSRVPARRDDQLSVESRRGAGPPGAGRPVRVLCSARPIRVWLGAVRYGSRSRNRARSAVCFEY